MTIVLFVAAALAGVAAVLVGWVFAALSQYSCDWETSTRPCTPWVTWAPSLVESIVLVAVFVGGAIGAARVRRSRPQGWAVAVGTATVMAIVVSVTSVVVAEHGG
ncbi:hypothetical protein H489_0113550 [Curtobacterium flaccumfaciens UCD-AKU]|uniref:hypothetical protein n=1 Tax=Curtobacterium flaccumfaciens TaxID=2035 RepID=UPI0003606BC2|nr:hypothetical protein [Curtobacterium flaccumfaciens]EYT62457.1 hypothetical protein H489_0113550 [Curtobacterium flaccumfaciens UCD-AKU]